MRGGWMAAACAALMVVGSAHAGPLPGNALDSDGAGWFYNRPGATVAEAEADRTTCRAMGSTMTAPSANAGAAYGLIGALVAVAVEAAMEAGPTAAYADDCMIARGYRRYRTQDRNLEAFNTRFAAMDDAQKAALVGGEAPQEGELVRAWANDYWIAREGDPAADTSAPRIVPATASMALTSVQSVRALEADAAIAPGAQDAVVILTLELEGAGNQRPSLLFSRVNLFSGAPDMAPIGRNGRMRWPQFIAHMGRAPRGGERAPEQFVYVIPAGSYVLATASSGQAMTQFCLGAASFTVEPGQVLHLGRFTISPGPRSAGATSPPALFGMRVDAGDLEQGRALLSRAPDLAARLQPAQYNNGVMRACQAAVGAFPVYGFDIPGAPYVQQAALAPKPDEAASTAPEGPKEPAAAAEAVPPPVVEGSAAASTEVQQAQPAESSSVSPPN